MYLKKEVFYLILIILFSSFSYAQGSTSWVQQQEQPDATRTEFTSQTQIQEAFAKSTPGKTTIEYTDTTTGNIYPAGTEILPGGNIRTPPNAYLTDAQGHRYSGTISIGDDGSMSFVGDDFSIIPAGQTQPISGSDAERFIAGTEDQRQAILEELGLVKRQGFDSQASPSPTDSKPSSDGNPTLPGDPSRVPVGGGAPKIGASPFQLQQMPGQRNDGVGGQGNAPVDFPSQGGIIWSMDTNYVPFTEDRNVDYYVGEAGYWFWILFLVFGFSCRRFSLCSNLLGTPEGLLMSRAH